MPAIALRHVIVTLLVLTAMLSGLAPAGAHRPSDAYLKLSVEGTSIDGRWEIALRDLEHAIGLDLDRDRTITWGELKARQEAIAADALGKLSLVSEGQPCPTRIRDHQVDRKSEATYAVLLFTASCPAPITALDIGYDFLFDLDPLHRGLLQLDHAGETWSLIFSPDQRRWRMGSGGTDLWHTLVSYLREGVWHIWIGFDHILFLISLLLPAVLQREAGGWRPAGSLRTASIEVVKVVTAFTLAHSITLALATLGFLVLPSGPVEAVIAASIVLAALNNIFPLVTRGLWLVAFGFGLIHGLGFAGVLQALGLPAEALIPALLSFNVGVELGQLAIVALFLPPAFALRGSRLYPHLVLRAGSLAIAVVAGIWLMERSQSVVVFS